MAGIGRVKTDNAQGVVTGPGASTVFADNKKVSLEKDGVAGHGKAPHSAPTLDSNFSSTVFADGKKVTKKGTVATCGHTLTPGSSTVEVD
tara:strand:+ start:461 stop:730 length:270 start_codon:yes stop_codon:yes gene_type:complete